MVDEREFSESGAGIVEDDEQEIVLTNNAANSGSFNRSSVDRNRHAGNYSSHTVTASIQANIQHEPTVN